MHPNQSSNEPARRALSGAGRTCQRCHEREGTLKFSEGVVAQIHGQYWLYCPRCVAELQLNHARERAALIPELEKTLATEGGPWKAPDLRVSLKARSTLGGE